MRYGKLCARYGKGHECNAAHFLWGAMAVGEDNASHLEQLFESRPDFSSIPPIEYDSGVYKKSPFLLRTTFLLTNKGKRVILTIMSFSENSIRGSQ